MDLKCIVRAAPNDCNDWNWEIEDERGSMHWLLPWSRASDCPAKGTPVGARGVLVGGRRFVPVGA